MSLWLSRRRRRSSYGRPPTTTLNFIHIITVLLFLLHPPHPPHTSHRPHHHSQRHDDGDVIMVVVVDSDPNGHFVGKTFANPQLICRTINPSICIWSTSQSDRPCHPSKQANKPELVNLKEARQKNLFSSSCKSVPSSRRKTWRAGIV